MLIVLQQLATPTLMSEATISSFHVEKKKLLPRKEVIHPQLPLRMPCYDFVPVISLTFVPQK
jgi:hypothetical protein